LHRLRDTLKKQTREVVANRLAQTRPPWREHRKSTAPAETVPRGFAAAARRPSGRQEKAIRFPSKTPREPETAPKQQKPVFEYWDFPNEAAVRELPPAFVSDAERSHFGELLRAGMGPSNDVGDELFVILGLDFGTSSTKMIVRLPYEAGEPTIAIPAPTPCLSGEDPYLWRTLLWLHEDGAFYPWPEPGTTILDALKQGLIHGRSETAVFTSGAPVAVTRAEAGVAYLAFAIRYAIGWLLRNRPHFFRGRKPMWFVNLGMPAASCDDPELAKPYRRIGAAALLLARLDGPVTVEAVRLFLEDPNVARAGSSEDAAGTLGVAVVPETAAEVTGFAKSTRGAPGLYLLVDVGALTLDACMFRLNQRAGKGDLYAFMNAQVRPLGVDSFQWFLSAGKTTRAFGEQCDRTLRSVVWGTKLRRDPKAECWKPGNDVPVFLAGGGAANRLHKDIVEALGPWLKEHTRNDGVNLIPLPVPRTLELPETLRDFGRLVVAWGLSYPPTDIGEIQAMRDIEDIPPCAITDHSSLFVSKDHI